MRVPSSGSVDVPSPLGARYSAAWTIAENGVVAGIIGALIVAVWFLVLDSLQGQPLSTPSLLGSVVFRGLAVEQVQAVDGAMVFAYTGLHGLLFLITGVVLAWTFSQIDMNPQFGVVLIVLFALFEAVLFGLEVTVVPRLVGVLGAATVALANILSAIGMFWFLLTRHPQLTRHLREGWDGSR